MASLSSKRVYRTVALGAITALAVIAIAPFFMDIYTTNILIRAFYLAALVMTVDILWGYTGILTFGQSAFFGIGAYACALVFTHYGFGPLWAIGALAIGILAALAVAAIVGWLAFYHGASPLYASIITLALPIVLVQLIFAGGRWTGSSSGLSAFPTYYWSTETWFWIAGAYLVLVTSLGFLLVRSDFGRILVAIRENEERAAYLGIPISRIKTGLMMASGAVGAAAGFGYAAFTNVVAPELGDFLLGTELLIWTALGGRGTLIGPVLGAIGIDVTASYLSGTLPFLWKLLTGIAFVVVIVLLPRGLAPILGQAIGFVIPPLRRKPPQSAELVPADWRPIAASFDAPPLKIDELICQYGSLRVLTGVNATVKGGELLSIVGPNGAGKTTLMRCVSDGSERTAGRVYVQGVEIGRGAPQSIVALGVGRSFQNTNLFDTLTVAECLMLARYGVDGAPMFARRAEIRMPEPALDIMRATGLDKVLATETGSLSHGMKRGLELAMVLATEPSVLLLDEPTAGLTKAERTAIGHTLKRLTDEYGLAVVLIEHDLDFVREISSRIVVLHQGSVLMEGTVEEVVNSELVRAVYSGEQVEAVA
ncbi:branched-chain amino acid ABC transporter ATP-binding protein/permease [Acuticoccus sp. M5D2P5]|uniref:branched-chain amino acid ABC transporter ATP-binding protein/permease n=1 Tax=Acuticoccus kalidii TaxID=2910977 RepID=UPI001F4213CB|nr:branched-chain amino acid ABC transporter ATP-binding protein/permease [Acuticoccus kalidii]MCF3931900.1 branched-chain amino acid ABC transporter ATP-binding protein/permease [Acuticoccus kalidii]